MGLAREVSHKIQWASPANRVVITWATDVFELRMAGDSSPLRRMSEPPIDRRPKLAAAIKATRKLKGPVAVAKLDRLSRDVNFVSSLMVHMVPFITVGLLTPNPFLLHLFAALAERERRIIGERTRLALAAAKARGVKLGGTDEQSIKNREAALARARGVAPRPERACRPAQPRQS